MLRTMPLRELLTNSSKAFNQKALPSCRWISPPLSLMRLPLVLFGSLPFQARRHRLPPTD